LVESPLPEVTASILVEACIAAAGRMLAAGAPALLRPALCATNRPALAATIAG
jgi:hypothetical protein